MRLNVENISFGYNRRLVLKELSLSIKAGEFLGLLGPNGSGKSTFLKNLLGFLKPSSGRIVFSGGGEALSHAESARRLAFVPQNSRPPASISVRDLILMGRLPHMKDRWAGYGKTDRQKVDEVIRVLGLENLAERGLEALSGGELQKAVIGRCLAQEGEILLLDEATSGLDLNHSIEIMELMKKKAGGEGKSIVAVLHDLNLAAQYCDRIVLLKDGRLLYQGNPASILTEDIIEEIYGVRAEVKNDEYGRPFVIPRRAAARAACPAWQEEALDVC